jgi:hypothetical protein
MTARSLRLTSLALFALGGCVTTAPNSGTSVSDDLAVLAPHLTCAIPPPGAAGATVNVTQNIVARFRGQTFSFDAQIQATPEEFDLVALDTLGRRAMSVKWRGGHMDFTRAQWLPIEVRPADILADIAIVYWPTEIVAPALTACGATLTAAANGRIVSVHNRDVIAVTYARGEGWNRAAHVSNKAFDFDIDIQSVELAP